MYSLNNVHVGAKLNRDQSFIQISSKYHLNMLLKKKIKPNSKHPCVSGHFGLKAQLAALPARCSARPNACSRSSVSKNEPAHSRGPAAHAALARPLAAQRALLPRRPTPSTRLSGILALRTPRPRPQPGPGPGNHHPAWA
jgi:hypothetical protein